MQAFFAMMWHCRDRRAQRVADQIRERILTTSYAQATRECGDGFLLLDMSASRQKAVGIESGLIIKTDECAVFGTLFSTDASDGRYKRKTKLSSIDEMNIIKSCGRSLISDYWGSYIAFIHDGKSFRIISDPTSSIPCYYLIKQGVLFAFSNFELCSFLHHFHFTIDREFIQTIIGYDKIQTGRTGIAEINELLGGHCLTRTADETDAEVIWDPRQISNDTNRSSSAQCASHLRDVTKNVLDAWASLYSTIAVSYSGGFDSSVILACLQNARSAPHIVALHYELMSRDISEADHARTGATQIGVPIEIQSISPARALPNVDDHPLSVRPHRHFCDTLSPARDETLQKLGCEAIFTGQGGDHVFFSSRDALAIADYLLDCGIGREFFKVWYESAIVSGVSMGRVIANAIPYSLWRKPRSAIVNAIKNRSSILKLNSGNSDTLERSLPAWTTEPKGIGPGKFKHINNIYHMLRAGENITSTNNIDVVHPLMSQPIIELCLRIPTYRLKINGESRGLARHAFTELIPQGVRARTMKGSATHYFTDQMNFNRSAIQSALADGYLANNGLISVSSLSSGIEEDARLRHSLSSHFLTCYAIEAWCRRWSKHIREQDLNTKTFLDKDSTF